MDSQHRLTTGNVARLTYVLAGVLPN